MERLLKFTDADNLESICYVDAAAVVGLYIDDLGNTNISTVGYDFSVAEHIEVARQMIWPDIPWMEAPNHPLPKLSPKDGCSEEPKKEDSWGATVTVPLMDIREGLSEAMKNHLSKLDLAEKLYKSETPSDGKTSLMKLSELIAKVEEEEPEPAPSTETPEAFAARMKALADRLQAENQSKTQ